MPGKSIPVRQPLICGVVIPYLKGTPLKAARHHTNPDNHQSKEEKEDLRLREHLQHLQAVT